MKPISLIRLALVITASAASLLTTACSSTQELSRLPVETSGSVTSARVIQHGDTVYVTGTVKPAKGRVMPHSTHVDVTLIGHHGQVVARAEDSIKPPHARSTRARLGRLPFTISFPTSATEQADRVLVSYHPENHGS